MVTLAQGLFVILHANLLPDNIVCFSKNSNCH